MATSCIVERTRPSPVILTSWSKDPDELSSSLWLQISAVRLPREPTNPERLKGFGYAEFEDIDSLFQALSLNEEVSPTPDGAGLVGTSPRVPPARTRHVPVQPWVLEMR